MKSLSLFFVFAILFFSSFATKITVGTGGTYSTITSALSAALPGDTLEISGTISGDGQKTTGISISKDITIIGKGSANTFIQGSDKLSSSDRRIFSVLAGAKLTLKNVTLRYGKPNSNGGAIENLGMLIIENCIIRDCEGKLGGGIRNGANGFLTIYNTVITTNSSSLRGGGINHIGLNLFIYCCTIESNTADEEGAGIQIENANSIITSSLIKNNKLLTIYKSNGAGLFIGNSTGNHINTLTNVTITGNLCNTAGFDSCYGGGIGIISSGGKSTLSLMNCTITDNQVANGKSIQAYSFSAGTETVIELTNCILYSSTSKNYFQYESEGKVILKRNYAIVNDVSMSITGVGNINNADALLNPLGNNGGLTQTHSLKTGSPAIDAGTELDAPLTDQRGAERNGSTDMGAFEYNGILGIEEEQTETLNFKVYPNPANDYLILESLKNQSSQYFLRDISGKILMKGQLNSGSEKLDIASLNKGIYLLEISNSEGNSVQKVVKE